MMKERSWMVIFCRLRRGGDDGKKQTGRTRDSRARSLHFLSMFGPLGLSLAPYVRSSRILSRWLKPIAAWYVNIAGYRRMGFKYDDLRSCPPFSTRVYKLAHIVTLQSLRNAPTSRGSDLDHI